MSCVHTACIKKHGRIVVLLFVAGLPALQRSESGQVRKEAATATNCECRGKARHLLLKAQFYPEVSRGHERCSTVGRVRIFCAELLCKLLNLIGYLVRDR